MRAVLSLAMMVLPLATASPGVARINRVYLEQKSYYLQTSDAAVDFSTGFLQAQVRTDAIDDFDSGVLDTPGPAGRLALTPPSDPLYPVFVAYSASYAGLASLAADYPLGTYHITLDNSATAATESRDVARTGDFTPTAPRLTNYSALTGIDPSQPFSFRFAAGLSPTTPGGAAVFALFDTATGIGPTDQGVGVADHVTVAAGTFQPGHRYIYDILWVSEVLNSDRVSSEDFYAFTRGTFTLAGIPEPASWAMLLLGFGTIGVSQRRTRASLA